MRAGSKVWTPVEYTVSPPTPGQHTQEILQDLLGIDRHTVDALAAKGIVRGMDAMGERPYAGLIVLDMSHGFAGPYRAVLLEQHGANVIKIGLPSRRRAASTQPWPRKTTPLQNILGRLHKTATLPS